ncbi:hypothetical protein PF005_g423 [Phytophthora fragariae]|uniref:Secreted protein n=1 Tax=Phytophthora fragariae TaxID=53985 RepID=A0A6A3ZNS4_9STRA|nr:hypothetical protein PF009_g464 [Phytophthora fragariae]KAE9031181.1 hypothetical protein PF011_g243 [Phytophthora fragariae]KAE9138859.1 hypothetical protein PF010_g807 [Phytophthora fragariae]KAE9140971.1 hypothetical protein PF007_g428 [Phytophthora fragariae]KAE9155781.1 hypothetical protein PF006_g298 [Phytophthora fragariae]
MSSPLHFSLLLRVSRVGCLACFPCAAVGVPLSLLGGPRPSFLSMYGPVSRSSHSDLVISNGGSSRLGG